jgi:hypothetical protein
MGRPFFPRRVAEQADTTQLEAEVERLKFTLESDAIDYSRIGSDRPRPPRHAMALPMGIVDGNRMAVLTTRCLIDYRYPIAGSDPRFRNLAVFNSDGRAPRTVFMLAPVVGRPDLTESRDPSVHWWYDNRFYLNGPPGGRYFGQLVPGRLPRVGTDLVDGNWSTNASIDLVMLYFPLNDPAVAALRPQDNLRIADPMAVARAAMAGRTDYLGFKFDLITPECVHEAETQLARAEHEASLWKHIAIGEAAALLMVVLGPAAAGAGGLAGFTGTVATTLESVEQTVGPKILAGLPSAAWHVAQRTLGGEQLGDVAWDEGGHLVLSTVVDGTPQRLAVAGVQRGTADEVTASRVLATVREFVRERPAHLLIHSSQGHGGMVSLIRDDAGVDLSSELLAAGLVALDANDRATLARQPTLIKAAAFALQGNRGPAVLDPRYQWAVQQLDALAGS